MENLNKEIKAVTDDATTMPTLHWQNWLRTSHQKQRQTPIGCLCQTTNMYFMDFRTLSHSPTTNYATEQLGNSEADPNTGCCLTRSCSLLFVKVSVKRWKKRQTTSNTKLETWRLHQFNYDRKNHLPFQLMTWWIRSAQVAHSVNGVSPTTRFSLHPERMLIRRRPKGKQGQGAMEMFQDVTYFSIFSCWTNVKNCGQNILESCLTYHKAS